MSGHATGRPRTAIETLQEFSVPLLAGVLIAIIWANIDPHAYHEAVEHEWFGVGTHLNLHFFANEVLMVFFFGIAARRDSTEGSSRGQADDVWPYVGTYGHISLVKSDPNVTRAFLKYVIALRTQPEWGQDELLARAAASQGVDPEELRVYATARMGLPEATTAVELVSVAAEPGHKGR